jgi:alpha-1,3-rhamnosyl/mannosyltransferase
MPGIEWLGAVADEALAALYSGALAVVYPSMYEGFGLPVLEAMQCGAPVVVGAAEALREVAGDGAICIAADEPGELTAVLRRFAMEPAWRQEWSGRSIARAAGFSWAKTAAETRGVYLEAIRRFERKA